MKKFAVIVGGGMGIRLGGEVPKQFLLLHNRPLIFHTIEKFTGIADKIILVLPASHFEFWDKLCEKYQPHFDVQLVAGGENRTQSVKNGLAMLSGKAIVSVHDAVRPLVSIKLIKEIFETAARLGNAIPVLPVKESLRKKHNNSTIAVNREDYMVIQTPQAFDLQILTNAYLQTGDLEFSDDASVLEHCGTQIHTVLGENSNIKITFKEDFAFAETLMNAMKP